MFLFDRVICISALLLLCISLQAQVGFTWEDQSSELDVSLRGLSVVDDNVIWASGENGTVVRTDNGGTTWSELTIPGADSLDFRDIHAFGTDTAFVLSSGSIGAIYKTTDAGKQWDRIYFNNIEGIFFDGFDFIDKNNGMAFSDPIDGKLYIIKTEDGENWNPVPLENLPNVKDEEYGFAGSGSGIQVLGESCFIGTGGSAARVFKSDDLGLTWEVVKTDFMHGKNAGIFSLCFWDAENGVAVGGDYVDAYNKENVAAYTSDGGATWTMSGTPTNGYRSCVTRSADLGMTVSVGTNGTDLSVDDGRTWMFVDETPLNTCEFGEKTIWGVGPKGKIAKIKIY